MLHKALVLLYEERTVTHERSTLSIWLRPFTYRMTGLEHTMQHSPLPLL